jgi:diketogulonate reductase-like aldo/keto reductase
MERRPFGWTHEPVPVVGQGTWQMERDARAEVVQALRAGLDLGMTFVDTAEMYGSGAVEEIVGEALAGRRDEVFLVTKVLPQNASRRGTVAACDRSLHRLGTDRVDLYLLHWPGPHPIEDTIAAFEELREKGKIRFWGLSNFDAEDLEEARNTPPAGRRVACDQVLYHLKERAIEHAVLPWCERHDVALMAYSPFGSGDFPGPSTPGGKELARIAKARGATPRQVALAFLLRRPAVFVIPKASSAAHAAENAGAAGITLDAEEIARIEAAFPLRERPATLPTL